MNAPRNSTWNRLTRSLFGLTAATGILLWLAQPPLGWSWLAWLALAPLISAIADPQLTTRRPYVQVGMAAWMYWIVTLYFIPIPHPWLWLGWILMSAYLALYWVAFVAISRWLIWNRGFAIWSVVPLVWAGLEWLRGWGPTSFAMILLSHTQYRHPVVLQVLEWVGGYGLSYFMVLYTTGVVGYWLNRRSRPGWELEAFYRRRQGLVLAIASLGLVVGYGSWRLSEVRKAWESLDRSAAPLALIIQGNIDTQFPQSAREMQDYFLRIQEDYRRLSQEGRQRYPAASVVIWPEGAWQQSVVANRLEDLAAGQWENQEALNWFWEYNLRLPGELSSAPLPEMIVGCGTYVLRPATDESTDRDFLPLHSFNSAVHWPAAVKYDKNFRVLFGEYLPLADQFPILNRLTPFAQNLSRGNVTRTFQIGQTRLLPSICFESTVPQLVRQHRRAVTTADGSSPDWLVNLTNDGWFFGTTCLDFHLACNVFRAVEQRRPCVVAANTGFSAEISPTGEILQQGPRRQEAVLPVRLSPAPELPSFYVAWGEWPGVVIAVAFLLFTRRRLLRSPTRPSETKTATDSAKEN